VQYKLTRDLEEKFFYQLFLLNGRSVKFSDQVKSLGVLLPITSLKDDIDIQRQVK